MTKRLLVGAVLLALVAWGPLGGAFVSGADALPGGAAVRDATTERAAPTQLQDASCNFSRLYDGTVDSVVSIRVRTESGRAGQGSGFVYDSAGHVVTNQHVVANASTVELRFSQGDWRTAEIVGTDVYSDLAVLDVGNVPEYVEPLNVTAAPVEPGQKVAALGNPFGFQGSITHGIVSAVNRSMSTQLGFTIPNTIQTDAPINPGNSGGPLVSCNGAVVGVNRATVGQNIGFAISAGTVTRVVPSLIENGSYEHPFLGIRSVEVSPIVAQANDLNTTQGVLVVSVLQGSPASGELRGSTATETVSGVTVPAGGDVIVAIDGDRIRSQEELASYLEEETRPGEEVEITVLRDGERRTVTVTIGERPEPGRTET